jgi:predicted transcriptional regulator
MNNIRKWCMSLLLILILGLIVKIGFSMIRTHGEEMGVDNRLPDLTITDKDVNLYGIEETTKYIKGIGVTKVYNSFLVVINMTNLGDVATGDFTMIWQLDNISSQDIPDRGVIPGGTVHGDVTEKHENWILSHSGCISEIHINSLAENETIQISIEPDDPRAVFMNFNFTEGSRHNLTIVIDPSDEIAEINETNNFVEKNVTLSFQDLPEDVVQPSQDVSRYLTDPEIAVGAGIGVIIIASVLSLTEIGKYNLLSFSIIPLYNRIMGKKALNHFLRGQIYGLIRERPGANYSHIKHVLKLQNGSLLYHLKVLEREGFIRSKNRGLKKLFYPTKLPSCYSDLNEKYPLGDDFTEGIILSAKQERILDIIKNNPRINQVEIARKTGLSKQTVNYNVTQLNRRSFIEFVDGNKRKKECVVADSS